MIQFECNEKFGNSCYWDLNKLAIFLLLFLIELLKIYFVSKILKIN